MEKSSFFNSNNGDRKYKAEDFAAYFNSLITNGVFPNPSTNLQVIPNNNMTVTVKAGKAWINGYVYINDSDLVLSIDNADGVLNRIDRVVVRFDTAGRAINAVVKKGVFAISPVALTLQRDADKYELGIADITVNKGAINITQANITDLRLNTSYCGIVNSLIQADTTTLFNQYQALVNDFETVKQAEFESWVASLQVILDENVAGNLLNLINENVNQIDTLSKIDTAGGTGTAITLTLSTLVNGYTKTFIASANNIGAATTINTKPLYKPNTTIAPTLVAGKAYTVWYNLASNCFFIKASAEGTATTAQVLATVPFSNQTDTGLIGTMPNIGSIGTQNLTTESAEYTIPAGYHNGLGKVKAVITGLIASVIKAGTTAGGIVGTFTADATATASQMLAGAKAYVNGVLVTGNIASKAAATYNPSTAVQTIAASQYLSGIQTISAVTGTATAADVANGKTFNSASGIGLTGNAIVITSITSGNGTLYNDAVVKTTSSINAELKAVSITKSGSYTVMYDVKSDVASPSYPTYTQVYQNGVAIGTLITTTNNSYSTITQSLTFAAGDRVSIYGYGVGYPGYVVNFKFTVTVPELAPTKIL